MGEEQARIMEALNAEAKDWRESWKAMKAERDEARAALAPLAAIIEARAVAGASATLADRLTNALDCRDAWSEQARKDEQRLAAERVRAEEAEAAIDEAQRWLVGLRHIYDVQRACAALDRSFIATGRAPAPPAEEKP